jgi:hypothetical protein
VAAKPFLVDDELKDYNLGLSQSWGESLSTHKKNQKRDLTTKNHENAEVLVGELSFWVFQGYNNVLPGIVNR